MSTSHRPRVLCVDDEASILNALRRVFLDEPWDLHFATSGEEGLAYIAKSDVDLVLSDFRMPGMDGVTFLKKVKEIRPDTMRIVLSGYADINLIVCALNEGEVYRFLAKPWNDEELQHNLRKALEHHRLSRENLRLNRELVAFNAELERKVDERTRELRELNRVLRVAQEILEVLPMPVLGLDAARTVLFANAKAREQLGGGGLVGTSVADLFEPELTGALRGGGAGGVLPMVVDGVPVGALIVGDDVALLGAAPAPPVESIP